MFQEFPVSMKKFFYSILILASILVFAYFVVLSDVSKLRKANPVETSMMRYREAEWAAKGQKKRIYQVWVPLSRVSPYLIKAALIGEDDKFWRHEGFDFDAIQKAMEKDLKTRRFRAGGSTISQQLAKNLYLSPEKSPVRKIEEAIITWKIERTLPKRRILEIYLNVVEWGDGIYGIEAASRHYFGKGASELTPMEAARLVSVLPNPRKYDPTGDQRYVLKRSEIIYNIMVRRGIVVPEYEELKDEFISPAAPLSVTAEPGGQPATNTPPDNPMTPVR